MIGSSNRPAGTGPKGRGGRNRLAPIAAGLLALALTGAAATQEDAPEQVGAPIILGPQPGLTDEAAISGGVPLAPAEEDPTLDAAQATGEVEVQELAPLESDYAGPLEPDQGGLGPDMWQDTDRALVEHYLPQIGPFTSPAARDLSRRLLLSAARPPTGPIAGRNLFALRAERLATVAPAEDMAALLAVAPERYVEPAGGGGQIGTLWLSDPDAACRTLGAAAVPATPDPERQKGQIFCQARAGEMEEARLGLDLLREQGQEDAGFATMIEAIGSGTPPASVETASPLTPLLAATLRAAKQPLTEAQIEAADGTLAAALATLPDLDPLLRTSLAERAVGYGLLSVEALTKLYAQQPSTAEELDRAIELAESAPDARSRALLFQAAGRATQPGVRATVIDKALELARHRGGYATAVRVYLPLIEPIAPAPELSWFADNAGRALFAAGRRELAQGWLRLAEREAVRDARAAAAVPHLRLLELIAGGQEDPALEQVPQTVSALGLPREQEIHLQGVLSGLELWPADAADLSAAEGYAPAAETESQLEDAASSERRGETVLLSLVALGPNGPAETHPSVLRDVIANLRQVRLEREARALALEAAIAAGV